MKNIHISYEKNILPQQSSFISENVSNLYSNITAWK